MTIGVHPPGTTFAGNLRPTGYSVAHPASRRVSLSPLRKNNPELPGRYTKGTTMKRIFAGMMTALLAAVLAGPTLAQSGYDLFQKALAKERAEGKLDEAIQLYKQIVKDNGGNRALASKALFQLGQCYEKLGNVEAQKAYQRVLRDYADQPEAQQARARLAALNVAVRQTAAAAAQTGPVLTELKLYLAEGQYALSPDGTKVAYTNRKKSLVVSDLATGTEKELAGAPAGGAASRPVWAPDSRRLAYWQFLNLKTQEIHVVSVETGEDRALGLQGEPLDWSPDGHSLLYATGSLDKTKASIGLFSFATGAATPLQLELDPSKLTVHSSNLRCRFSPDGRYLAYAARDGNASHLYVMPVNNPAPVKITDGQARDSDPVWAPDGRLLFVSNRAFGGRPGLWSVAVAEGQPQGDPVLVVPDIGEVQLYSMSVTGRLLMQRVNAESHLYVTGVDPATAQPIGEATRLTKSSLGAYNAVWSPNGQRIAYLARFGERALRVMSANGEDDREVAKWGGPSMPPYAWSADSEHIYLTEIRPETGRGIYAVSVSTGERQPLLLDEELVGHLSCSRDGKRLAFLRGLQKPQIWVLDLASKEKKQLTFDSKNVSVMFPTVSPDGNQIAFSQRGGGKWSLMLLSIETGEVKELQSANSNFFFPTWLPDGHTIAWNTFTLQTKNEIRTASVPGGENYLPFRVNLGSTAEAQAFGPSWSPDGTKVVFEVGTFVQQILVMENFLPVQKAAK